MQYLYGQKVYNVYWGGYHGKTYGTCVANRGQIRVEEYTYQYCFKSKIA
jgi:hypothetical protein